VVVNVISWVWFAFDMVDASVHLKLVMLQPSERK
jgi:hypothetical protein